MRWIQRYYKRDVEARRESRVRVTNSPRSDGPHSPPSTTPIFISKNASTFFLQNMQHKYSSLKNASTFLHHSQHQYSSLKMAQIFFNICNTNFHLKKRCLNFSSTSAAPIFISEKCLNFVSSARSSYSHPYLLLIHHPPLTFQIEPVLKNNMEH